MTTRQLKRLGLSARLWCLRRLAIFLIYRNWRWVRGAGLNVWLIHRIYDLDGRLRRDRV